MTQWIVLGGGGVGTAFGGKGGKGDGAGGDGTGDGTSGGAGGDGGDGGGGGINGGTGGDGTGMVHEQKQAQWPLPCPILLNTLFRHGHMPSPPQ